MHFTAGVAIFVEHLLRVPLCTHRSVLGSVDALARPSRRAVDSVARSAIESLCARCVKVCVGRALGDGGDVLRERVLERAPATLRDVEAQLQCL